MYFITINQGWSIIFSSIFGMTASQKLVPLKLSTVKKFSFFLAFMWETSDCGVHTFLMYRYYPLCNTIFHNPVLGMHLGSNYGVKTKALASLSITGPVLYSSSTEYVHNAIMGAANCLY